MAEYWQSDDCFFSLLRDKSAINNVFSEAFGIVTADGNISSTAKVENQLIGEGLAAKTGSEKPDWLPRYM